MTRLVLSLLGPFQATIDGEPFLRSGLGKSHALLVYLAVENGKAHRRAALADLFWPDQPPERGRHRLRQMLLDLQKALRTREDAPAFLALDKESVRFCADMAQLDVVRFAAAGMRCQPGPDYCARCLGEMESHIAFYRGEFMAGLSLSDCPDFEDWLQVQRESLHRRALALLEQLSNCHEQAGNLEQALGFAQRHTQLTPWDEFAHRRAMQLYAMSGQTSAALRQYQHCCDLLERELGALPSRETRQLAERIRNGEFRREPLTTAPPQSLAPMPLERRQVTILYCELSTAETGDPDEAMALLEAPQARCMEIVREHSGHIVQTHGGGLLAYFGYPKADEYAARHAVQAALAVTQEGFGGVGVRAGVHTGLIIAGNDPAMPDIVGKSSNIAIHLRQAVAGNEVAIGPETHRLVAGYFECRSLGMQALPGIGQAMEIYRVVAASGAQTRLDAAAHLTAFTGRKAEVDRLMALWQQAARGTRSTILLRGEAGVGKSRLLLALKERLVGKPHAIREFRCFPEFTHSPFHPLISALETLFGFEPHDTPRKKFARLAERFETLYPETAPDAVPLLAPLLSLPVLAPYRDRNAAPQQQKEATIAILLDLLNQLSARHPVLLVVEDLHWVDPSTLELLTAFVAQKGKMPILAVLTSRPQFVPAWQGAVDQVLDLEPLDRMEAERMVASIDAEIPATVVRQIVERADGVPLFIEEMAKLASVDDGEGIPSTLNDLLAARLDAMGRAKYVAQFAAAIGREFDLDLLRKACPPEAGDALAAIAALEEAGLVLPVREGARQFKHALIQEAACLSQARSARQAAHRRIAQVLSADFPEVTSARPELLAQHWSAADDAVKAVPLWLAAGRHAVDHFAYKEAVSHYAECLRMLPSLPSGTERDRLEFEVLVSWARTEQRESGFGQGRSEELLLRATALLEQGIGNASDLFQLLWSRWEGSGARTGHCEGVQIGQQLMDIARHQDDRALLLQAHYALGVSLFWMGELADAGRHLEAAVALENQDTRLLAHAHFGYILLVGPRSYLAWVLWLQGSTDVANAMSRETLELAQRSEDVTAQAFALTFAARLQRWQGNVEEALRLVEEGRRIAVKCNSRILENVIAMISWWGAVVHGDKTAILPFQRNIGAIRQTYSGATVASLALYAETLMLLDKTEDALGVLDETLRLSEEKQDAHFLAELHRLRGVCFEKLSQTDVARQCFEKALAVSRAQGALAFERRARTNLAAIGDGG